MGEGKEAAPKAGVDGTAEPQQPPPPVVLKVELHCAGCAKKVRNSIKGMPGVQSVKADAAANRVVVAGTADAAALKARIESRTKKPVEIVSAGAGKPAAPAEAKKSNPDKENSDKKNPDKGDKAGSSDPPAPPKEEPKEKKQPQPQQPAEEKKPAEAQEPTTVLLRIRLHCDGCADRIRRRIYKIKGVKDVLMDGNAKDEVKVVGTMDVAAMVAYLTEKLNRAVEAVAPGKKGKAGDEEKKGKGGDGGEKKQDKAAGGDHVVTKDKGKGIEVQTGPSMASAAASMAPAPVQASTHHVSPYGHVPYPQPQAPPYGYYGGNAGGGYYQQQQHHPGANPGGYYQQQQHPSADYYNQPRDTGSYYQHPPSSGGGYYQQENPQAYPPPYHFDTAPPPQMFSDENPNSCSVM